MGVCTYNVSTKGVRGVAGLLTIANIFEFLG